MYDYEIDETMKRFCYSLPSSVYDEIISNSPQICRCTYSAWTDSFDMWTKDGSHWGFKVYKDSE